VIVPSTCLKEGAGRGRKGPTALGSWRKGASNRGRGSIGADEGDIQKRNGSQGNGIFLILREDQEKN